ncbi:DUF2950 domain-containing protein [Labrys miyagiensis]|nr:DUF2950 domain-containing protein [Labrys miyagiensis]
MAGSLFSALLLVSSSQAGLAQQVFSSPQEAADALVNAARNPGSAALDDIFGTGARQILSAGDEEVDRERIADFLALADNGHSVVEERPGVATLLFGADGWRFPVPLREKDGKWTFDLAAGRQEIRNRAIGRNELTAIASCSAYVEAQREYYDQIRDDEPVQQYARRFISSPGRHDGLWWKPESPRDRSPLGDLIAAAAVERTSAKDSPTPYYGYIYRILTRQGAAAPGGAYGYIVGGRMLAGFALIAYPERWGETGVMTFLCDQQGQVYQRNLGPGTASEAARIDTFDPRPGWEAVHD